MRVAFGTDAGVSKHGRNADEFELLVKFGLTPMQAIQAATVNAADLLGLASDVGTLEAGKWADFVLWDVERPAELVCRIGFNPLHRRVRHGIAS